MRGLQAELVHNPASLDPIGSPIPVENQRLPHPNGLVRHRVVHGPVLARGLPVPGRCGPVSPEAGGILPVAETEEVPLIRIELGHIYKIESSNY